jgi:CRP/FNR family transcriptional regulator
MAHAVTFRFQDPRTYLPRRPVQQFAKRHVIYDATRPSENLYVIIQGRVKITTTAYEGAAAISRIIGADRLFGEAALVTPERHSESAMALDQVSLMAWTRTEIEEMVEREPHLGVALSQYLVRECVELQKRIEAMALYKTDVRVMLALLHLSSTLGSPLADGTTRMAALPHHTLAEYVGTSREVVTFQLNRLRRLGLVNYSRKVIDVRTPAMEKLLLEQDIPLPGRWDWGGKVGVQSSS